MVASSKHTIVGIYTRTEDWSDVVLVARATFVFKNGAKVPDADVADRVTLVFDDKGGVKGTLWKPYIVSHEFS